MNVSIDICKYYMNVSPIEVKIHIAACFAKFSSFPKTDEFGHSLISETKLEPNLSLTV